MAKAEIAIKVDADAVVEWFKENDIVAVTRCCKCVYWDRGTITHHFNDFRSWNEAICGQLAERDCYNDINQYTEADDYCSYGERREE